MPLKLVRSLVSYGMLNKDTDQFLARAASLTSAPSPRKQGQDSQNPCSNEFWHEYKYFETGMRDISGIHSV